MFSDNFVRLCNTIGKGVTVVAEEIGYSANAGAKWASGSMPRRTTLLKIADYFGITVEELTAETKKPATDSGDGEDAKLKRNIQFALFDGDKNVTQEDVEAVFNYYKFLQSQRGKK